METKEQNSGKKDCPRQAILSFGPLRLICLPSYSFAGRNNALSCLWNKQQPVPGERTCAWTLQACMQQPDLVLGLKQVFEKWLQTAVTTGFAFSSSEFSLTSDEWKGEMDTAPSQPRRIQHRANREHVFIQNRRLFAARKNGQPSSLSRNRRKRIKAHGEEFKLDSRDGFPKRVWMIIVCCKENWA